MLGDDWEFLPCRDVMKCRVSCCCKGGQDCVTNMFTYFCPSLLIQAKKLVESLPQEIRANVSKEEAEKLKAALEAAGGTVVLE